MNPPVSSHGPQTAPAYPGALYHVIWRGNEQRDIFFDEEDRYRFYELLDEGVARFGCRVHAFCLMSNHVHLALQAGKDPLSAPMQNLAFRYTQVINRKLKRVGHLSAGATRRSVLR